MRRPVTVTAVAAAFRLQLRVIRADPDYVMPVFTAPFFAVIFLEVIRHAGRHDLTGYGVMAPVLIALWALSLYVSGGIIDADRAQGVLEAVVASPAPFALLVVARVASVGIVALVSVVEAWLVAWLVFGVVVRIYHPAVFVASLLVTVFATSGIGVMMAAVFVVARNVRNFQNALTYPMYILGGILVPIAFLPHWVQPLSHVVFLSWSADLLRDALARAPVANAFARLAVVAGLGCAYLLIGYWLTQRVLGRVRRDGTIGHA